MKYDHWQYKDEVKFMQYMHRHVYHFSSSKWSKPYHVIQCFYILNPHVIKITKGNRFDYVVLDTYYVL